MHQQSFASSSVLIIALIGSALIVHRAAPLHAAQAAQKVMPGSIGDWTFELILNESKLSLKHASSGVTISGTLAFVAQSDKGPQPWTIAPPRDSVSTRPALLDAEGNVQGYLNVTGSGDTLAVTVVHRAAQAYRGTLAFRAVVELGDQTFACRTRAPINARIVQMAAGPADSRLNDSLFDVPTDTALRFDGRSVSVVTQRSEGRTTRPRFDIELTATPHDAAHSALVFQIVRRYYRDRYVPYYKPIDKKRCPSAPTGWMSWNVYFDRAGEKENLDEARVGATHLKPFGMEIWSIESWQDNSDRLPVQKFHNLTLRPDPRKFPRGMKWLADQIRQIGFRPGIWTVPFGTGDKAFYEAHKDWFLHHPDGRPMQNWNGYYVVDPSQEAVRKHMEDTHRIMSQDWGYEYFKIDGMSGRSPGYSAHFFERPEVRAAFKQPCDDPFRLCVEALRRGMGPDRIWLACQGHYTGPEIGQADAGRLGGDIVHANQPPHWANYHHQASTVLNQLFVHNIVWYGDPDTLMVGTFAPTPLARLATTVVGLPGQMMFAGDKLAELPADRMRLYQQVLPVCDTRPLDLFPIFEMLPVWDLKVALPFASWDVVSLFNWTEKDAQVGVRFDELGLPADREYLVYDFWNQRLLGRFKTEYACTLPGHSNGLLAVHPALDRPQFLSSDRHITQGAVDLEDLRWNDAACTLSGRVRLVQNHPTNLVFCVPKTFEPVSATSPSPETKLLTTPRPDGTLTLNIQRSTSGPAEWQLTFKRRG